MARKPPGNPGLEPKHFVHEETQVEFEVEFKTPDKVEEMVDAFNRLIGLNEGGVLEDSLKRSISVAGSYADSPEGIEAGFDAANRAKGVLGEMGMKVGAIQARARANAMHFFQRGVYLPPEDEDEEAEAPWYEDFFDRVRSGLLDIVPGGDTLKRMRRVGGVASIAVAILAILMFVQRMFGHSQILNTYSTAFMKIFGHFTDLIMIVFLPILNSALIFLITKVRPVVASFSEWLKDHPSIANIVFAAFLALPFWGLIGKLLAMAIQLAGGMVPWWKIFQRQQPPVGIDPVTGRPRTRARSRWWRRWRSLRRRIFNRLPRPVRRGLLRARAIYRKAVRYIRRIPRNIYRRIMRPIRRIGRFVSRFGRALWGYSRHINRFAGRVVSGLRNIYRTQIRPRIPKPVRNAGRVIANQARNLANQAKRLYNNIRRSSGQAVGLLDRQRRNLLNGIKRASQIAKRYAASGLRTVRSIASSIRGTVRQGVRLATAGLLGPVSRGWNRAITLADDAARAVLSTRAGRAVAGVANRGWTTKFTRASRLGGIFAGLLVSFEAYSLATRGEFTEDNFRDWLKQTGYLAFLFTNTGLAGELVLLGFTGLGVAAHSEAAQKSNQILTNLIVGEEYYKKVDGKLTDGSIVKLTKRYGNIDEVYGYAHVEERYGRVVPVQIDLTARGQLALETPYSMDSLGTQTTYIIEDVGLTEMQEIWNKLTDPQTQIDILSGIQQESARYLPETTGALSRGYQEFNRRISDLTRY